MRPSTPSNPSGSSVPAGTCAWLLVTLLTLAATGCGPEPADMQAWLRMERGPLRVAAFVSDATRPLPLRVAAARTLAEHGHAIELGSALERCTVAQRGHIVAGIAGALERMLGGPLEAQVRAKEAIYYVGGYAPEPVRSRLAQGVIRWAFEDLPRRVRMGNSSLLQVLPALGTAVALPALRALHRPGPKADLVRIITALKQPAVEGAAARILAARALAQRPKLDLDLAQALVLLRRPELTPALVELVDDPRIPTKLRDPLLDHIVATAGPAAGAGLVRLLRNEPVRWIAAQHLLTLEGLDGLGRLLRELPADAAYAQANEELFVSVDFFCEQNVPSIKADRTRLELVLLDALRQAPWPGKLVAMHCLGKWGSAAALPELGRASYFTRRLGGWSPEGSSLGQVARDAATAIRGR